VIPHDHSMELRKVMKGFAMEHYIDNQGHVNFKVESQIMPAMKQFFEEIDMTFNQLELDGRIADSKLVSIPEEYFERDRRKKDENGFFGNIWKNLTGN